MSIVIRSERAFIAVGTADLHGVATIVPSELIVGCAAEAAELIGRLRAVAGAPAHASLIRY